MKKPSASDLEGVVDALNKVVTKYKDGSFQLDSHVTSLDTTTRYLLDGGSDGTPWRGRSREAFIGSWLERRARLTQASSLLTQATSDLKFFIQRVQDQLPTIRSVESLLQGSDGNTLSPDDQNSLLNEESDAQNMILLELSFLNSALEQLAEEVGDCPEEKNEEPDDYLNYNKTFSGFSPEEETLADEIAGDYSGTGATKEEILEIIAHEKSRNAGITIGELDTKIRDFLNTFTKDELDQANALGVKFSDIYILKTEHRNPKTGVPNLTNNNAIQALVGPPGTTPMVIGRDQGGADISFVDKDGNVVGSREVETTQGTFSTFNTAVSDGADQVKYDGNVFVQVPDGTDAPNWVARFRGIRKQRGDIGKYQDVTLTIVDRDGNVLFNGPIVS